MVLFSGKPFHTFPNIHKSIYILVNSVASIIINCQISEKEQKNMTLEPRQTTKKLRTTKSKPILMFPLLDVEKIKNL
jgi:hypothetical protein